MNRRYVGIEIAILDDPEIEELMDKHGHIVMTAIVSIRAYLMDRRDYTGSLSSLAKLSGRYQIDEQIINDVICDSGLFTIQEGNFFDVVVNKRMASYDSMAGGGSKGGKQRALNAGQKLKNSPNNNNGPES